MAETMTAAETITAGMAAMIPPGAPLSFTEVVRAVWEGRGRSRRAVGDVVMFDGVIGQVTVFRWGGDIHAGWGHQWINVGVEGTYCHLDPETNTWQRVTPEAS